MTTTIETISPAELSERRKTGPVLLIDVRTPAEYEELHAEGAKLTPLDRLDPKALAAECPAGEFIYFICRSGGRGKQACEKLRTAGLDRVVNVEGGTLAWEQAGLPVHRGRRTISLERQVRIAAGALVLLGTALGAFVDPAFLGLAAFVGAGLVFAGITDTCGMGILLGRMPWNRRGGNGKRAGTTSSPSCSV